MCCGYHYFDGTHLYNGCRKDQFDTANFEELTKLKGIGPAYAQRIIDYREKHGPFERIEDLMKVKGIGPKTFNANKDMITVE